MNKRHEHADIIHAWAEGARIQFRNKGTTGPWNNAAFPRFLEDREYRVAPLRITISYRLYLRKDSNGDHHISCYEPSFCASPEASEDFVQWITNDFQSYTIDHGDTREAVINALATGKPIQLRYSHGWADYQPFPEGHEFRVKPAAKVLRCRQYLSRDFDGEHRIENLTLGIDDTCQDIERMSNFVSWVDKEPVEVEVEI